MAMVDRSSTKVKEANRRVRNVLVGNPADRLSFTRPVLAKLHAARCLVIVLALLSFVPEIQKILAALTSRLSGCPLEWVKVLRWQSSV